MLIDARTGEQLAADEPDRRLSIASTTKLMTAHLALKRLRLGRQVEAAPYYAIPGESLLGLTPGERVTVRDLLYGLILASGNDAAETLAVAVSGSEEAFVGLMNDAARALGLADTHYGNPIGLDEAGNYSTASDLVALARVLLRNPVFRRIADSETANAPSLDPPQTIETRNTLLLADPSVTGVKTGHTLGAGYVLVGSAERNGVELISAVLGAPSEYDRDVETQELLDYGFGLYSTRRAFRRGEALARPGIDYEDDRLALRAARGVALGIRADQNLRVRVDAPAEVEGPIRRGERLGTAVVLVDGRRVARVPLRAARDVAEAGTIERVGSRLMGPLGIAALGVFAILIAGTAVMRRRRRDHGGFAA